MQTIKTAVVVVMLLAVLYGAYVALNGSETPLPQELMNMAELDVQADFDGKTTRQASLPPINNLGSNAPLGAPVNQGNGFTTSGSPSNVIDTNLAFDPPKNPSQPMNPASSSASPLAPPPNSPALSAPPPKLLASNSNAPLAPPPSPFPTPSNNASPSRSLPPLAPEGSSSAMAGGSPQLSLPNQHGSANTLNAASNSPAADWGLNSNSSNSLAGGQTAIDPPSLGDSQSKPVGLPNATTSRSFLNAKKMAEEQIGRGELKEALATMSLFYNAVELTHEQHTELLEMLDPLAGEVIYSRRHLLDIAYVTNQGEVLEDIAKQYEVPADILAKINAVDPVAPLPAGTRLKVVPGPFRAEIDLQRSELTLFVGELYAGRFAIEFGNQPAPAEGVYQILEKQRHRNYYGPGGILITGTDPRNPYGGWWMDLGQDLCIHGTPEQPTPSSEKIGCISLSPIDASDVYGMLSRGSKVQIRR